MDEFTENNNDVTQDEPEAPEAEAKTKAKAAEIEVEVEDTAYKLESVPDDPTNYIVDSKVTDAEGFDEALLDDFREVAFSGKITQKQFGKVISWWNKTGVKFNKTGFGQDFEDSFMGFAKRQGIGQGQVAGLKQWFTAIQKKNERLLEQVKSFARRAGGDSKNADRLAAIARIQSSRAYKEKGSTGAERAQHKQAVRLMLELTRR